MVLDFQLLEGRQDPRGVRVEPELLHGILCRGRHRGLLVPDPEAAAFGPGVADVREHILDNSAIVGERLEDEDVLS